MSGRKLREIPARLAAAGEELPAAPAAKTRGRKGKKKRDCHKCGGSHFPPTGLKCQQQPPPPADVTDEEDALQEVQEEIRPKGTAQDMSQVAELTQTLKGFMTVLTQQLPQLQPGAQQVPTVTGHAPADGRPRVAQPDPGLVPPVTGLPQPQEAGRPRVLPVPSVTDQTRASGRPRNKGPPAGPPAVLPRDRYLRDHDSRRTHSMLRLTRYRRTPSMFR